MRVSTDLGAKETKSSTEKTDEGEVRKALSLSRLEEEVNADEVVVVLNEHRNQMSEVFSTLTNPREEREL